jgi:four helix bundle protein
MKINRFEDILAWQKAKTLVLRIHELFKSSKNFSFRDQIQRAAVSIMNNIAEGFERGSNSELSRFLFIAKGSSGEVRSMANLAGELGYISGEEMTEIINLSSEISRMLSGLITSIRDNKNKN